MDETAKPRRVEVTTEFLATARARQAAYAEQRRLHRQAWFRPAEAETETEQAPEPAQAGRPRARGKIHDRRQDSLDL